MALGPELNDSSKPSVTLSHACRLEVRQLAACARWAWSQNEHGFAHKKTKQTSGTMVLKMWIVNTVKCMYQKTKDYILDRHASRGIFEGILE